jgi:hypothetical protein
MHQPSTRAIALASAGIGCGLFAALALAQARIPMTKNVAQLPQSEITLSDRVGQLEITVKALQARLAEDEAKLKTVEDNANQAKAGVALVNIGLGKQVENVKAEQAQYESSTNAAIADAGQKLGALTDRFNSHGHKYNSLYLLLHSDNTIKQMTYKVETSQGPNN